MRCVQVKAGRPYEAVSYTHLDVYKRQQALRAHARQEIGRYLVAFVEQSAQSFKFPRVLRPRLHAQMCIRDRNITVKKKLNTF